MARTDYQLAPGVHFCTSDGRIVFLDLRRNRYLCLNRRNSENAAILIGGPDLFNEKRHAPVDAAVYSNTEDTRLLVAALIQKGLLTRGSANGGETACCHIPLAARSTLSAKSKAKRAASAINWASFIRASLTASWKLRWYSMQRTVESVKHRKQGHPLAPTNGQQNLPELVEIFNCLRPYYIRRYLCLYDSLALIEFLALYQLFPRWVFGVTAEPFNAHCWVQERDQVLNDTVEYVRSFTPIMAI